MEWFENESHWQTLYNLIFDTERFESAKEEVTQALQLVQLSPPASVLDLACGPGRHATVLAQRGFEVTAVDRSPYLLHKARAHMVSSDTHFELVQMDMRDFCQTARYDLILNLYNSFGYFQTRGEDLAVLRNVCDSLNVRGQFILETVSRSRLESNCRTRWEELSDGTLSIQHVKPLSDWSRIRIEWLVARGQELSRFKYEHNIYSAEELRDMLLQVGFANVRLYSDLSGSAYYEDASKIVIVGGRSTRGDGRDLPRARRGY
jgi:SAM-dependent methyltransferase